MAQQRRPSTSTAGRATSGASALLARALDLHRQGQLSQAAAAYRRVLAVQPEHPDALHLLGMTDLARGRPDEALSSIERAIDTRPEVAAFHGSRAAALLACGSVAEAITAAVRAIEIDPGRADAHNVLGNALLADRQTAAAVQAYRQALRLRPDYVEALNNLGSGLRAQGGLEEAEQALRSAVALRPAYAAALANLGLVLQERGCYREALESLEQAVRADPTLPAARANRGMLLLLLGELERGFADYEWRWLLPGFSTPRRAFSQLLWDGIPLQGRTLFVHAEQGLGSAIQFVRYLPLATRQGQARVVLECQRPLARLFKTSFQGGLAVSAEIVSKGDEPPAFDVHLPLMSLPHRFGTTLTTIPADVPYLRSDPADIERWRGLLSHDPRPRVGIVWAGNPQHENDRNRSMPASHLDQLAAAGIGTIYGLQVPISDADAERLDAQSIRNLAPDLADFAETAAVLTVLDLVISVDTAVAHLAGALARPVWLLLPAVPEWRWMLDRDDSPWYPTMRLFRQQQPGDWAELVRRVATALRTWQPANDVSTAAEERG